MDTPCPHGFGRQRHNTGVLYDETPHEKPAPDMFKREIWPKLRSRPVIELVRATGLSYSYCNHIKNGRMVPHARWWGVLRELV
jgi:hypothetical protein